jgi:hypothetical protein
MYFGKAFMFAKNLNAGKMFNISSFFWGRSSPASSNILIFLTLSQLLELSFSPFLIKVAEI